jgi:hypothetical protein
MADFFKKSNDNRFKRLYLKKEIDFFKIIFYIFISKYYFNTFTPSLN